MNIALLFALYDAPFRNASYSNSCCCVWWWKSSAWRQATRCALYATLRLPEAKNKQTLMKCLIKMQFKQIAQWHKRRRTRCDATEKEVLGVALLGAMARRCIPHWRDKEALSWSVLCVMRTHVDNNLCDRAIIRRDMRLCSSCIYIY